MQIIRHGNPFLQQNCHKRFQMGFFGPDFLNESKLGQTTHAVTSKMIY